MSVLDGIGLIFAAIIIALMIYFTTLVPYLLMLALVLQLTSFSVVAAGTGSIKKAFRSSHKVWYLFWILIRGFYMSAWKFTHRLIRDIFKQH